MMIPLIILSQGVQTPFLFVTSNLCPSRRTDITLLHITTTTTNDIGSCFPHALIHSPNTELP